MRIKSFLLLFLILPSFLIAGPDNTKNPDSVEIRGGASSSSGSTSPMGSFLYQRFLDENWVIGLAIQPILISQEIEGGSLIERSKRTITLTPIDFMFGYFFSTESNFKPYIRGYAGPAIVKGAGAQETLFHLGAGLGFRYYFTDEVFGSAEIGGNAFALQEKTRSQNGPFAQVGVGLAF